MLTSASVDRLLASPHYGEKWGAAWLDLARYADSDGYEKDRARPWAWRYRQWVIDALNRDMPFDEFTIDQLAGDLLPNAPIEQLVGHRVPSATRSPTAKAASIREQFRFEQVVNRDQHRGHSWLGLTVGCAQCHNHKYDPISQKELLPALRVLQYAGRGEYRRAHARRARALPGGAARRTSNKRDEMLAEYKRAGS